MGNFTNILAVEKGTPAFNLFMSLLSDALFWLLPGETVRARKHCEALGMTPEQIDKLKRQRRTCRPCSAIGSGRIQGGSRARSVA